VSRWLLRPLIGLCVDGGIARSVYSSNQPRKKGTLGETLNTLID
jgi:hypothetical protein